jgi:hypothetical protein
MSIAKRFGIAIWMLCSKIEDSREKNKWFVKQFEIN